jgi:hypothetical protein
MLFESNGGYLDEQNSCNFVSQKSIDCHLEHHPYYEIKNVVPLF